MELFSDGNPINDYTIFSVTLNEAKIVAKALLEDAKITHKDAKINVNIEGK